ncbi:hypothetical protein AJ79_01715 [Helicocarpus griseus UAMH5409]|uniref:Uncharacterized protein n=1 Tax=Helicocarpus griseus UAMH5409 TaxID=1447875 RepID=A0A2B7Y6U2_9EURO|nr:hypothetical protein AJ79_01715 [Helicocarpus griseus UAMH5409]
MLPFLSPQSRLRHYLYALAVWLVLQACYTPPTSAAPVADSIDIAPGLTVTKTNPPTPAVIHKRAGAPINAPYPHPLPRHRVPTIDELTAVIDYYESGIAGSKISLFFSGVQGGYMIVRNWARVELNKERCDICLYNDCIPSYIFNYYANAEREYKFTESEEKTFFAHLSAAYAKRVRGTIYVLLPDGGEPSPQSVWTVWEFPYLTWNEHVDEIIRLDYNKDQKKVTKQTVIWKKGDPQKQLPS